MTNETTENFWKVMSEWVPPEPKEIFWRLYHTADGFPIVYSMEELPYDHYIEIDQATYSQYNMHVRVIDGQLVSRPPATLVNKLKPADVGTPCDPRDICVVVSPDQPNRKWTIVQNEIN
jgi:hypothetical protein